MAVGLAVAPGDEVGLLVGPAVGAAVDEAVGKGLLVGEGEGLAVGEAVGDVEAATNVKLNGAQDFVSAAGTFLGAVGATA